MANPKPEETFRAFFGERAVVESNARRIKGTDLLQMNGWVTRIGFDERECLREAGGNETRNLDRQSDSKRCVAACFVMVIGAFDCVVEPARKLILLNLAIPLVGDELLKPL